MSGVLLAKFYQKNLLVGYFQATRISIIKLLLQFASVTALHKVIFFHPSCQKNIVLFKLGAILTIVKKIPAQACPNLGRDCPYHYHPQL